MADNDQIDDAPPIVHTDQPPAKTEVADGNDKPYSIFTHNEKRSIVLCAGLCMIFSPISGQIYFPSLDAIAKDLNVSHSLVNLTITAYLVSRTPTMLNLIHSDPALT